MDDCRKPLLALGLGVATGLGLWWWMTRRADLEDALATVPPAPLQIGQALDTPVAQVAKVYLYPLKSGHRIEIESAECLVRGLQYDRCWVVVDKDGRFVNQRTTPTMALIQPRLDFAEDGSVKLCLTAPDMPELVVCEPRGNAPTSVVRVWELCGEGVDVGDEAAGWMSHFLSKEGCRVHYMSPEHKPRVLLEDERWTDITKPGEQTSFADFAPLLIASEASLDLLNSKLESPIPIERFRPNIILTGCAAHTEDTLGHIRIGETLTLRGLKPCGRCKMTTVDQEKGYFTGAEPLQTLRKYRLHETVYKCKREARYDSSPLFGYHFTVIQPGVLKKGDTVYCGLKNI